MHLVYTLQDPVTHEVRYVGVTNSPLSIRLSQHCHHARRGKKWHVSNWIRTLNGKRPLIVKQGEYAEREEALAAEIEYIRRLRADGYKLTNLTKGGEGTWGWASSLPKETSTSISLAHPRKKRTP